MIDDLQAKSDAEIHMETLAASVNEKRATFELLRYLHEVDRRRIFAARGFSSLFVYVTKVLGYSERQAQERISAMRLSFQHEEVRQSLEAGRVTLTNLSILASHVRAEKIPAVEMGALIQKAETLSKRELEQVLAPTEPVKSREVVKICSQSQAEIRFVADAELLALLEVVKQTGRNPGETLNSIFKSALKALQQARAERNQPKRAATLPPPAVEAPRQTPQTRHTRYLPIRTRGEVVQRAGDRCEYIDSETGRRCGGQNALEFHHETPFAWGGGRDASNLKLFCRAHNALQAVRDFGEEIRPIPRASMLRS